MTIGCYGELDLYNKSSGSLITTVGVSDGATIVSLAYVNQSVFAGAGGNNVYFWSTGYTPLYTLATGHTGGISQIVLVSTQTLVTVAGDAKAKVWNLNTYQSTLTYSEHTAAITGIILLHNGNVASWSTSIVRIWSWANANTVTYFDIGNTAEEVAQVSTEILAVGWVNNVGFYSMSNGSLLSSIGGFSSDITGILAYSANMVVVIDFNGNMKISNWLNGTLYANGGYDYFGTAMAKTVSGDIVKVGGYSYGGVMTVAYIGINNAALSLKWMANVSASTNRKPKSALPMDTIQLRNAIILELQIFILISISL